MANREFLPILNQGVEGWNAWREKHPDAELSQSNRARANLTNAILAAADFNCANLKGANLVGARTERALRMDNAAMP